MKQSFIIIGWVCIAVTSFASAADLRLLDSSGDLQSLEKDAQFLTQSDTEPTNDTSIVSLDISEDIQSPRSRDIDICRKRCLYTAVCVSCSLVVPAIIYALTQRYAS